MISVFLWYAIFNFIRGGVSYQKSAQHEIKIWLTLNLWSKCSFECSFQFNQTFFFLRFFSFCITKGRSRLFGMSVCSSFELIPSRAVSIQAILLRLPLGHTFPFIHSFSRMFIPLGNIFKPWGLLFSRRVPL